VQQIKQDKKPPASRQKPVFGGIFHLAQGHSATAKAHILLLFAKFSK